jgi:2-(1,2-epoxy-1,2-dihydrophenyl)acetyl-CoA isomerase
MNLTTLDYAHDGGVATLTLNRPQVLNSFCAAMHADLAAAFTAIEQDPAIRCVVLTGAGRGFCAGQDLGEARTTEVGDAGERLERLYNPLILRMRRLPVPIVCAVNGVAAGAGASLALACDIVIAARSAKFIQAFVRIGLVPDAGSTWFLPRLVGDARARALAMTGDAIDAAQAADWGLIWRCVDDAELASATQALAARLAGLPTRAIALIKQAFLAGAGNDLAAQLRLERELQREAGATADAVEGVAAFVEKRPPQFSGR